MDDVIEKALIGSSECRGTHHQEVSAGNAQHGPTDVRDG